MFTEKSNIKVGILTLPPRYNYGGILQAYALQKHLKTLGYDAYLIDREPPKAPGRKIMTWIKEHVVEGPTRDFVKKWLSPRTQVIKDQSTMQKIVQEYGFDALVVGSDQVWRLEYSPIALNYFFDFAESSPVKKISYAASFGVDNWNHPAEVTNKVKALVQNMDAVSVREDTGVEICKTAFNVDAIQVIDPTLLLKQTDYLELINSEPNTPTKNRLAVYVLDSSGEKQQIIDRIAAHKKLSPLPLNVKRSFSKQNLLKLRECIYPKVTNWLFGFYQSDFIVTDSFHGVAFSIIFNKQFIAIGNKGRGLARFQSILKLFNISDRLIFSPEDLTPELMDRKIDYEMVEKIRDAKRVEANNFLTSSLSIKAEKI